MSTRVVVELTPDEEKVLNAFRRVQAADENTRAGLKLTGEAGEAAAKALTDGFIKGGKESGKSITRLVAEMKRSGDVGKSVGTSIDKHLSEIGVGGKRSIDQIIESMERLQPEVAERARQMVAEFEAADRVKKFEATRRELEGLGGYFETLAGEIKQATSEPLESATKRAQEMVAELREIDPDKAEAIATAMERAKVATREAEFDRLITEMRAGTAEADALAKALDGEVKQAAFEASGGFAAMVTEAKKLRPEMSGFIDKFVTDWEAAEKRTQLTTLRTELSALGGDFAVLGTEIDKAFAIPLEQASKRAREIVQEISTLDPDRAEQLASALDRAGEAIDSSKVDELVQTLANGTDEAKQLANILGDGMRSSSLEAAGGVDAVADKIIALRPEMSAFVEQWRADMAEAAQYGEGQYEKVLNALRAGDPVSKKVADRIRENLVAAGKVGERSFEDMIKPLENIDPAMAEEARKMKAHFDDMESKGKGAFSGISNFAKSELTQIVVAYVGVQEAIQFVTDTIREQQEVLKDASDAHRSLAVAQQEAYKNLASFDDKTQDTLIQKFAIEVADEAKIPQIEAIVDAIGATASAGANFEQLQEAVRAAALLNRLTPESIETTAGSLFDFARATGNNDAEENASQMFLLASQSRITDPAKVFKNAAPVLVAGSNMAPEGRRQEVASSAAAIFSALTKAGADTQGDSASTAAIQFMNRLDEFFESLGQDATEAKKKLAELKKEDPLSAAQRLDMERLSTNEANANRTNAQIKHLQGIIDREQRFQDERPEGTTKEELRESGIRERKAREALTKVSKSEFDETDAARLEDLRAKLGEADRKYQAEMAKLQAKIAAANVKGFKGKLPETIDDQLRTLQSNPEIMESFLADKFGEQRFRPGFDQLVRGGQAYQDFLGTQQVLQQNLGRTDLFDRSVEQSRSRTPAMLLDFNAAVADTGKAIRDVTAVTSASLSEVRRITAEALRESRAGGAAGFGQAIGETGIGFGLTLSGGDFASEAISAIQKLSNRREYFAADGIDNAAEAEKVDRIDSAIESLVGMFNDLSLPRLSAADLRDAERSADFALRYDRDTGQLRDKPDEQIGPIMQRILDALERAEKLHKKTEQNTRPKPPGVAPGQRATANIPPTVQTGGGR
jgi:molybdopterin converting factor small subunit